MESRFSRAILFMLAGPLIWAVHFLFIYAVNGVNCARPALQISWAGLPLSSWIIVVASMAALTAMVLIHLRHRANRPPGGRPEFRLWLAGALSLLSAVAIVWETLPVLMMRHCL